MLDMTKGSTKAPFDTARLDKLMDEAGIDVLLVTSKHNVQYLLGGHRAFFFESMDAMGLSRYLPVFVYAKGGAPKAGFFGHRMENFQNDVKPFWASEVNCRSSGSAGSSARRGTWRGGLGSFAVADLLGWRAGRPLPAGDRSCSTSPSAQSRLRSIPRGSTD